MSYLNEPRLVFSGDFLSDVSTVNNNPAHYNNATFKPEFQKFGKRGTNGWWNPEGGAVFSFQNCIVQQITFPDGTTATDPATDIVLAQLLTGPGDKATGKMVDLDPQAQGCSELWSIKLRLTTSDNALLLEGDLATTPFRDLQLRQSQGGDINGQPLGASWTSVLTNLQWGEKAQDSPFLTLLRNTTQGNRLSINLNGFGYYYNHAPDGRFSLGRIIGSIGPWFEQEPLLFAPTRRLYGLYAQGQNKSIFFSYNNFLVDQDKNALTLDLGNSFPITDALGTISINQQLIVGVSKSPLNNAPDTNPILVNSDSFLTIGAINYQSGSTEWLMKTGGICQFNNLSAEILNLLKDHQLLLLTPSSTPGQFAVLAGESANGYFVRADNFVQRIDYGDTNTVQIYAYQWGKPLANASIEVTLEPPTTVTPVSDKNPISEVPGNNYPIDGIRFKNTIITDENGCASLEITGNSINNPRGYIDGQIYTLDVQLLNIPNDPAGYAENIIIHLRDNYQVPEIVNWSDIAETMTQYSNLYPIMSKYIVNLADPESVKSRKDILIFAFSRPIEDVLHMPVTRDLSKSKRDAILKWLNTPNPAVSSLAATTDKSVPPSPAAPGQPLTTQQERLKAIAKSKSAIHIDTEEFPNLFENL